MKRVLALCLCAALLLSLAACGSAPEVTLPAPEGAEAPTPTPEPTPTPTPEPTPEPTPSVVKLTLAGDLVMHTPLHDEALQLARGRGATSWHVSITHDGGIAAAVAILEAA